MVGFLSLSCAAFLLAPYLFSDSEETSPKPAVAEKDKPPLGLITSLPIYWNEGDTFAELGKGAEADLPWVRGAIEQQYRIKPLDVLAPVEGAADEAGNLLGDLQRLAIIQPRGLSPADNVALDEWVRQGGQLLYVIDPMLTGEYETPLGDPRHPTVTALVPPVLARWGISLSFDEDQSGEPYLAEWDTLAFPIVMGGRFARMSKVESDPSTSGDCNIEADGLVARCALEDGSITLVADAALFEPREGNAEAEQAVLGMLSKALE